MGVARGFFKVGLGFAATYALVWGNLDRFSQWYTARLVLTKMYECLRARGGTGWGQERCSGGGKGRDGVFFSLRCVLRSRCARAALRCARTAPSLLRLRLFSSCASTSTSPPSSLQAHADTDFHSLLLLLQTQQHTQTPTPDLSLSLFVAATPSLFVARRQLEMTDEREAQKRLDAERAKMQMGQT